MAKNDENENVVRNRNSYFVIDYKEEIGSYEVELKDLVKSSLGSGSYTSLGERTLSAYSVLMSARSRLNEKRNRWYDELESSNFKPEFNSDNGVRFFHQTSSEVENTPSYRDIEALAGRYIKQAFDSVSQQAAEEKKVLILNACAQLSRYLPDFEERRPHYFIDSHSSKIGVTFQGGGTLTLLIGATTEIEFSYAEKQQSGMTRVSGTAKLTKHLRNSKNIWKLLQLQGRTD